MSQLVWDAVGEKIWETGVDHAVLYKPNAGGDYDTGFAWNGITAINESPSGAESNKQYADNIVYANLKSAEEFGATIEAFTYPEEFAECEGISVVDGVEVGQQSRKPFGLYWRTRVGNDLEGDAFGEKHHLAYGCDAAPSEKNRQTVNDSPEATAFSWELTTTPVAIPGNNPLTGKPWRPTSKLTIPSVGTDPTALAALLTILHGSEGVDPRLPTPAEVMALFAGSIVVATPTVPTFDTGTDEITIPSVTGVVYKIDGTAVTGVVEIENPTIVKAYPLPGYKLPDVFVNAWLYTP